MLKRHTWGAGDILASPSPHSCLTLQWSLGSLSAGLWKREGQFRSLNACVCNWSWKFHCSKRNMCQRHSTWPHSRFCPVAIWEFARGLSLQSQNIWVHLFFFFKVCPLLGAFTDLLILIYYWQGDCMLHLPISSHKGSSPLFHLKFEWSLIYVLSIYTVHDKHPISAYCWPNILCTLLDFILLVLSCSAVSDSANL